MNSNAKDYYYILGIAKNASKDEIKKAYRKLSTKFHPDKNDGDKFFEERFKDINEAYETLVDDAKRKIYDELFANGRTANEQTSYSPPPKKKPAIRPLFTIIGILIVVSPLIRLAINEADKKKKTETSDKITPTDTTHNPVTLVKVFNDSENDVTSPPGSPIPDSSGPIPPSDKDREHKDSEQQMFKDDVGLSAVDVVNNFFNAFTIHDCHAAWSMTYNTYWRKQGVDWFCSYNAFGGVSKVVVNNIARIIQTDNSAEVYADYYAEDIYNGNKCFKQTLTLQKMLYDDNTQRWTITKMKNSEEPVACNENQ